MSAREIAEAYRAAARRDCRLQVDYSADRVSGLDTPLEVPEHGAVMPVNATPANPLGDGAYVEALVWVPAYRVAPAPHNPPPAAGDAGQGANTPPPPAPATGAPTAASATRRLLDELWPLLEARDRVAHTALRGTGAPGWGSTAPAPGTQAVRPCGGCGAPTCATCARRVRAGYPAPRR
jgi:hypothetical protein